MIKVLYFGRLSDRAGHREEQLDLPQGVNTLGSLKTWLENSRELGGALLDPSVKTMINQVLVHEDAALSGDEEIGFLPPVGGG